MRSALRRLRRSPGFTLIALACLALGAGVTTTIFSVVDGVLLRPLPYADDGGLITLHARNIAKDVRASRVSWADYTSVRSENHTLSGLGLWTTGFLQLTGAEGDVERVDAAQISASLFPVLGLQPIAGRNFRSDDEQSGGERVVLLSDALWRRRYAANPAILNHPIEIGGQPSIVVGIMPPRAGFPEGAQIWTPIAVDPAKQRHGNRQYLGAVGRLSPGRSISDARADIAAISLRLQQAFPADNDGWDAEVGSLRDDLVGALRRPVLVFLGAAAIVLIVASANVGNLMLARAALRRHDTAIAVAIGATRGRIVKDTLTESVLLALAGGLLGLAIAAFGVKLIGLAFPDGVPSYLTISIDARAIVFTTLVSIVAGTLFGLAPALRATRVTLVAVLQEAGRGADRGGGKWLRQALVAAEVAMSLVLLVAATLLVRSDWTLEREIGFDPRGVLTLRVPLPQAEYPGPARRVFYEELFTRIRALPGVEAVGSSQGLPFGPTGGSTDRARIGVVGRAVAAGEDRSSLRLEVSPDYFRAMGTVVRSGRAFTAADSAPGLRVAVVNEVFGRRYFPGESAIGRPITFDDDPPGTPAITIVGIAGNMRQDRPPQPVEPIVYMPFSASSQSLIVRTSAADPMTLAPAVRGVVREMNPRLPVYLVQSLEHVVLGALWRQRLQGRVLGIFAIVALVLAVAGVYSVTSYTVAQETRQLGVRMALGATRGQVVGLVLKRAASLAGIGIAAGSAAAVGVSYVIASLLYGVPPVDPATFVGAAATLGIASMLAAVGPALRAARIDPLRAMRAE